MNTALFNDNGKCGYVLKPDILRNPTSKFDPYDTNTMLNKKYLRLKIISAQNLPLPRRNGLIKDIPDPYVIVRIAGVPADKAEERTKTIDNNGFNPIWNENFEFVVNCPDLAFVSFVVKDEDIGVDDSIGAFTLRFSNMKQGYTYIIT
jgi:Ca2+-dependent lipid-binding protein